MFMVYTRPAQVCAFFHQEENTRVIFKPNLEFQDHFLVFMRGYEIFKDEVKPQDLSRAFLHEFMNLPESYFQPGAPTKFNDFISRWGTHYIKSAKFGGQLQIRKLQSGRSISTKAEFAVEAEAEYRGLFASGGGYSSSKGGSQQKTETKFMSTSVQALGGSQRIAAAVADVYTPIFKNTLLDWLDSINDYPKAFKFIMGSITDLVDFRAIDLFPDENVDWGCEANSHNLVEEGNTGRYYYGDTNKTFCEYRSRSEIEFKLKQRRSSLKTAIQAYMEEGPVSATDISIRAGEGGCETQDLEDSLAIPNWDDITKQEETFHVIFDMDNELRGRNNIPKTMSRSVKLRDNTWFTASENGEFHLYSGFNNAGSPTPSNKKISIFGLVLTLDETDGSLTLAMTDHNESSNYFTNLDEYLKGKSLARIVWPPATLFSRMSTDSTAIHTPCNAKWSNPLRFDPNDPDQDKCVHFTAFAKGTVYIIFSSIPTAKETWYYIEISKYGVVIYKGEKMIDFTINQNAVSIGSSNLYQSYYACLTETPTSTVIEYGKTQGNTAYGDNYLTVIDHANPPIRARFFTFGNGENDAQVMDIQVTPRSGLTQECKGGTAQDASGQLCLRKPCHETCDEREGCRPPAGHTPLPSECYSCKYAKEDGNCVLSCASGFVPNKNKICQRNYDLTFKDSHTLHSTILAPSALSAFTLCLWIKFPTYSSEYLHREYSILRYVYDEIYTDRVFFRLNVKYEVTKKPSFVLQFYHDLRDVANENSDAEMKLEPSRDIDTTKWNTVCITRESKTGQTHLLWYGEETLTGNKHFIPGYTMKKGGEFILGGLAWRLPSDITNYPIDGNLPVSVSQINVWDRKLTNDQISAIFKHEKCDGGAGNILDWEDFKSAVTLSQYIKTEPSTCASGSAMMF